MPKSDLDRQFRLNIEEYVPLAPFTSFRVGGPARFLIGARTLRELREALRFADRMKLPFCILGGGSNLLVSDEGFPGVAIRLLMNRVTRSGGMVRVQGGFDLTALVHRTVGWGLSGLESLAGIPGTVGGAVRGNAGAYGGAIADALATVSALDAATLHSVTLRRDQCAFGYRDSRFKRDPGLIVVGALLALTPGDRDEIGTKVAETLAKREAKQLSCDLSAGSFFMNPVVDDAGLIRRFEEDQGVRCRECRIPAGWLIDQAGLRSLRVGGAAVSHRHANYLVNTGAATAAEIVELARQVRKEVQVKLGVVLREEVSPLGVVI
ncbi:UDP-N-acetylmuramate dehydrogenase [Geomonas sp. Red69]|uniref:UDP-N-acetylenolpyruvoylglucosamine reductase n=1 Tax=Geomonas diazotrophica TaxID=2843197 RepID=A0ABX8JJA1_9BACT|nr:MULTISPECIES: UDP-N-acetylmuramate dehydrogenase [Geomonas]MBU5636725.1 UDP-N-acetylmuramate dehydrogenase [Geomonas diazotrophica]QWV98464.1 UDP-N-acetylmuramate dehydrogenase [Geomonas nitrogeniifigens]QXE87646.1 UDP-N-acetylmuramate dehydrogenase [Geomonas nitrogeniifigens]